MPEMQEVYRMATQKVRPDAGFVDRQHRNQRRRMRNRKYGAIGVVAILGVLAIALAVATRPGGSSTTPASQPPPTFRVDPEAMQVATDFVGAYGASDAERASSSLAEDADISGVVTYERAAGDAHEDLRLTLALLKAEGYRQTVHPCEVTGVGASGSVVSCAFDFHSLGSDKIGRGPFGGSEFMITVRDGKITRALISWDLARFAQQMWEPFTRWVSDTYPADARTMYADSGLERLSERSISLWERHVRDYVEQVQQGAG